MNHKMNTEGWQVKPIKHKTKDIVIAIIVLTFILIGLPLLGCFI